METPESTLTDAELVSKLLKWWKVKELRFVGKLQRNDVGSFFNEVLANGRPLRYPDGLGNVGVFCPNASKLTPNSYYEFYCDLAPAKIRAQKSNPYLLNVDSGKSIILVENFELPESSNEFFIKDIFNIRGLTPDDAARTARQLRLNELELYTQTERFIFELIQNADDMPKTTAGVNINFLLTKDFFVFLHTGQPFLREHVEAISDAGKSTKSRDTNRTGYKGIGFKSVFSDAQAVYIHSGFFSFRFDKTYFKGISFTDLYASHIESLNPSGKRAFFSRYERTQNQHTAIESIPWQIKPIWTPPKEFPPELQEVPNILRSEVSIALRIGNSTIRSKNYEGILANLFAEPEFLLFLRNVRNLSVETGETNLDINIHRVGYLKTITTVEKGTNNQDIENYITDKGQYHIDIGNDAFDAIGLPMSILTEGDKNLFKKKDGTEINNIPEKLAQLDVTTLSFAAKINKHKIVREANEGSRLFNYLPTNDRRFGFPFLVNADFITTTNRETIIAENLWNIYLFYYIGFYAIKWIADTALIRTTDDARASLKQSVLALLPKKQTESRDIHQFFNNGMKKGIEQVPFLPGEYCTNLLLASEAVLDKTNVFKEATIYESAFKKLYPQAELIKYDLLYTSEKLCNEEDYGFCVLTFGRDEIKNLFHLEDFGPKLDPRHNASLLRLLKKNELVDVLKEFESLPNQKNILKRPETIFFTCDQEDKKWIMFDEGIDFLHQDLLMIAGKHVDIKDILQSDLGVKEFRPVDYIRSKLSSFKDINPILSEEGANRNFWSFVFKYRGALSDEDLSKLQSFLVVTTNSSTALLKDCYLSVEYETTYAIEQVAKELLLSQLAFVSPKYIENSDERLEYRRFFNRCQVKPSEGWELYRHEVKKILLANGINEQNYLVLTKFIFDVFRNNPGKFTQQEKDVLKRLPLRTIVNRLQPATSCVLENSIAVNILPEYAFENQVSSTYEQAESGHEWRAFLVAIGVSELSDNETIKRKIDKVVSSVASVTNEQSVKIWRVLHKYQSAFANDNAYKAKVKIIPIRLKNDSLASLSSAVLYFPNEYKPATNVEDLLTGFYDFFVAPSLLESDQEASSWKLLLTSLGVNEKLASSGFGNNFQISHLEFLVHHAYALKFWNYFQSTFAVSEINTNSIFRKAIIEMASIPCLDCGMRRPNEVFPNDPQFIALINDESKIAAVTFSADLIELLGINTRVELLESDNAYLKYLGNLGESYVYAELKKEFSIKGSLRDTDYGFLVEKNGTSIAEVHWNNKVAISESVRTLADSGNPFDFMIRESNVTKFIESKATFRDSKVFLMPESEWNWMLSNKEVYYIYRVNNVTTAPFISTKTLAVEALLTGKIRPTEFPVSIIV